MKITRSELLQLRLHPTKFKTCGRYEFAEDTRNRYCRCTKPTGDWVSRCSMCRTLRRVFTGVDYVNYR
jgi:predicted Zn-ribbon and HTH transcriptional regulator